MNYNKKTVYDVDVKGKKVLLRCDFNVPQDKKTGEITSDKRIKAALPTIRYLLDNGAAVIACSHLGKPVATFEGYVKKQVEKGKNAEDVTREEWEKSLRKLTLAPVAKHLAELLGQDVIFASDVVGEDAQAKAAALQPGQIMLLENLRFEKGETKNDPALAKKLADMAELYVSDAFGTVHRAHASTAGVAAYLPAVSGLLVAKELSVMGKALDDPKRPFVAVLGGAKVSDKINVINNLLEKADTIIIGGGMAYTFKKAQGFEVGKSLLEADRLDYAKDMIAKAEAKGVKFLLPVDNYCAAEFSADAEPVLVEGNIPENLMGMDIGPKSHGQGAGRVRRDHDRRRRRQRGRGREAGLCRQDHPHLHRRRRQPRVPRGQGAAGRGLPAGQVRKEPHQSASPTAQRDVRPLIRQTKSDTFPRGGRLQRKEPHQSALPTASPEGKPVRKG